MKKKVKLIHKILKQHNPKATKKAKKLFGFKYPKIFLLIFSILLAYFIFRNPSVSSYISRLEGLSYLGIFASGMLIAFGFSAAFAVGFFIVSHPQNIFLAAAIGAAGSVISNLLIFKFIRFSFKDEFNGIQNEKSFSDIKRIVKENISIKIRHYILYLFAGILIATPLPDEIGISLLAGLTTIKSKILAIITFVLHFAEIFIILYLSS